MQNYELNGVSSSAVTPQINLDNVLSDMENQIHSDAQKLMNLYQQGLVTDNQVQYFTNKLIDTRNKINLLKQNNQPLNTQSEFDGKTLEEQLNVTDSFEAFNQEQPDFFNKSGRKDVYNYIKNLNMDKDEISKIAALVELIEKSAIDNYLKQSAHDKTLNDENFAAKQKLTSYAQKGIYDSNNHKVFTREDIGAMSGEEFAKNEKLIMEQVKQGLIR